MENTTNLIVAAPREYIAAAARTGLPVAHIIYRIGRGYHLYRAQGTEFVRGGLMVVDTDGFTGGGPAAAFVAELLHECEKSGFTGIVLDTGGRSSAQLTSLTAHLASDAKARGLKVYVPEALASASEHVIALVPSALSGGTLSDHIGEALKKYDGRVALEIERVRMDFSLPAVTGAGRELTAEELQALIEQQHAQSFLSKDLCAYYFTYHDKKGTRFVLYDNAASIRRKLTVASRLGIENAFIFYPQVEDIIDKIIAP
ncbi:hypothetical protein SAMN02745823_01499 [Sporobacter termitidis DSM 10068]|uniref:Uncharacterized protein n=1 Tax=Sporobacter termitidis DSM 10068 TaxID=1123282 RepID=A0A1M5WZR5_9FIRM|nr:hypothetical protein [Sporobacter termitidis]SHH93165.1 hypothetical protein SAMN02745823_01499 [Sporobacter termitidis DSM 10068]